MRLPPLFCLFYSQKGSILVPALAASIITIGIGSVILNQAYVSNKKAKESRTLATALQLETTLRQHLLKATSYDCANKPGTTEKDPATCQPSTSQIEQIFQNTTTAGNCDGGGPTNDGQNSQAACSRILLKDQKYDLPTRTYEAVIASIEQNTNIPPISLPVKIEIPEDTFTSVGFICDATMPIFNGFDANGNPKCESLTNLECPAGEYISEINPGLMTRKCKPIGQAITCPNNQMIGNYQWVGAQQLEFSCLDRPDPDTYFSFTPNVVEGPAEGGGSSLPSPPPVTTTTTTVITTTTLPSGPASPVTTTTRPLRRAACLPLKYDWGGRCCDNPPYVNGRAMYCLRGDGGR